MTLSSVRSCKYQGSSVSVRASRASIHQQAGTAAHSSQNPAERLPKCGAVERGIAHRQPPVQRTDEADDGGCIRQLGQRNPAAWRGVDIHRDSQADERDQPGQTQHPGRRARQRIQDGIHGRQRCQGRPTSAFGAALCQKRVNDGMARGGSSNCRATGSASMPADTIVCM